MEQLLYKLALMSLGLKFGDEVIVPGFGYMAAANVALSMGLKPIFVDVDEKTWCIDINSLSNIISKTKVVNSNSYLWKYV